MADLTHQPGRFLAELKRRRVFRVVAGYAAVAFLLWQVAEYLVPALGVADPDRTINLVVIISLFGFPVAVILSWIYDLVPGGIVRTGPLEEPREAGASPDPSGGAVDPLFPYPTVPTGKSIAVLPFQNLSSDQEGQYFIDGVTDEILAHLTRLRDVKVVSRNSANAYRGTKKGAREIGRALGVTKLLEGSVRKAERRVRIFANLVDAETDRQLWSETYDRDLEDIFAIQSDLAERIAAALEAELAPDELDRLDRHPTEDLYAYDLYLRARFEWNRRTEQGLNASLRYLERALAQDPDFALALVGLADSYTVLGIYNAAPPKAVFPKALEAADRALKLDPESGRARAARGSVRVMYEWDWQSGERDFRTCLELEPQYATGRQWYAMHCLVPRGRFEEARFQLQQAKELDPLSGAVDASIGFTRYLERAHEDAIAIFRDILAREDRFATALHFLALAEEASGEYEAAIEALERAREIRPQSSELLAALGHVHATAGRADEARRTLAELSALPGDAYASPTRLADLALALGDQERALAYLEEACDHRAADLIWIGHLPGFDALRGDERFRSVLARIGLA